MDLKIPFQYVFVALILIAIEWACKDWILVDEKKIVLTTSFLTGLYLLFHFVFLLLRKKYVDSIGFNFLILLSLKFAFILFFLFFYLNPMDAENKRVVLLFLINYFSFLITDLILKVRLLNLK